MNTVDIDRILGTEPVIDPPPAFADAVMRSVLVEQARRRRGTGLEVTLGWASAAALAFAGIVTAGELRDLGGALPVVGASPGSVLVLCVQLAIAGAWLWVLPRVSRG